MKRYGWIILAISLITYITGCGKRQQAMEESQELISMEALTSSGPVTQTIVPESKALKTQGSQIQPVTVAKLEPLPPPGPYKPQAVEIQTALKNAGYYTAEIDGKIGPKTRKAIEEFQKANNLEVDGKVGPKTWAILSAYLNPIPPIETKKR